MYRSLTLLLLFCCLPAQAQMSLSASYFADSDTAHEYGAMAALDTAGFGFSLGAYRTRYEQLIPLESGDLIQGVADGSRVSAGAYKVLGNWDLSVSGFSADSEDGIKNQELSLGAAYYGGSWMVRASAITAAFEAEQLIEYSIDQFSTRRLHEISRDGLGAGLEAGYFFTERWYVTAGSRLMFYDDAEGLVDRTRLVTRTLLNQYQRPRESVLYLGTTRFGNYADWSLDYSYDSTVDDGYRTHTLFSALSVPLGEQLRLIASAGASHGDWGDTSLFGGLDVVIRLSK